MSRLNPTFLCQLDFKLPSVLNNRILRHLQTMIARMLDLQSFEQTGSSTNIRMERWKLSNRPLRNKHLSCSTQRSLIRVWSHKKCWFCASQTGMQAGLGLQGHIARNWSQRQGLYISCFFFGWLLHGSTKVFTLVGHGCYLSMAWHQEPRWKIECKYQKYDGNTDAFIHTHTHTPTLCASLSQCRSEFETFTYWACRNLDDGVGMWHCAAFSQRQVQHETAWYVETHI